jgi:molecular chaperone DnaK
LRRLAYEVELAKRRLSEERVAKTTVPVMFRGKDAEFELDRGEFEELTRPLVERTADLTRCLLASAHVSWSNINYLIPVGGATHMPMIARRLRGFASTPGGPQLRTISPELSIAQGAALFSGIIQSEGDVDKLGAGMMAHVLSRYRTVNVSASSLGIVVRNRAGKYVNHKLIERNAPLPSSANVVVSTVQPNQRRVKIRIMEGDAAPEEEEKLICHCVLDALPENLPADSKFDVNLMYDADGLLQVIAEHRASGRLATVSIQRR